MLTARSNTIIEARTGKQIAVVLPSNCSQKEARRIAELAAEAMNGDVRLEERNAAFEAGWRAAAEWAKRDDLTADIGSPAYLADRDAALMPNC